MSEQSQNGGGVVALVRNHMSFINNHSGVLEKFCAPGTRADALQAYVEHELNANENLRACTPASVYLALMACAVTGLLPGKLRGLSFLVPFNNTVGDRKTMEATFMVGWRGYKYQAIRAGLNFQSATIRQRDDFDFDKGSSPFVRYKPSLAGGGEIIGSAAWCMMPRGALELEWLDMPTLAAIQEAAERRGPSPAWRGKFRDQMMRKSALRRLGKQVEMGEEFYKADRMELAFNDHGSLAPVLDEFTDGSATRVLAQQSAEAAAFGATPRPAQATVPVMVGGHVVGHMKEAEARPTSAPSPSSSPSSSPAKSGGGEKAARTPRGERPTGSSAGSSPDAAATSSATSDERPTSAAGSAGHAAATSAAGAATSSRPVTQSAGTTQSSSALVDPTPAGSSDASSTESPAAIGSASPSESPGGADGLVDEPGMFDDDSTAEPKKSMADFKAWVASCKSKDELKAGKDAWLAWAKDEMGWKAADKKAGTPASAEVTEMQKAFAERYAAVK